MIRDEFKVHMLNDLGKEEAKAMAEHFSDLLEKLELMCGAKEGRYMAIVRTKLEEACFFAKKAMALQGENQQK